MAVAAAAAAAVMTAVKVGVAAHRECNRNGHEGNERHYSDGS